MSSQEPVESRDWDSASTTLRAHHQLSAEHEKCQYDKTILNIVERAEGAACICVVVCEKSLSRNKATGQIEASMVALQCPYGRLRAALEALK